jgi:hypothetical protein
MVGSGSRHSLLGGWHAALKGAAAVPALAHLPIRRLERAFVTHVSTHNIAIERKPA